jgi:hypothetical protein
MTLAESLPAKGYTTFGVASNSHPGDQCGFVRGVDYFPCLPFLPADRVNETVFTWAEDNQSADK